MSRVWLALWLAGCSRAGPDGAGAEDRDGDGAAAGYDCDDEDPQRSPLHPEVCNGVDDDCSGSADENPVDASRWYADDDRDGHGSPTRSALGCVAPPGMIAGNDDCDDDDASVYPGATERCDAKDQNCNGQIDEGAEQRSFWRDRDRDGYGDAADTVAACELPAGYAETSDDCDDGDPDVFPGAPEPDCADPRDYDCDGLGASDADGDGFYGCDDCDDTRDDVHPDAAETCDALNVDDDCDGKADDDDIGPSGRVLYYIDADADGYGLGVGVLRCDPSGARSTPVAGDCDDANPASNPGEIEICDPDDVDEDCDGFADDTDSTASGTASFYADSDGDGWGAGIPDKRCDPTAGYPTTSNGDCDDTSDARSPGLPEICDADDIDEDCDDLADDNDSAASGTTEWYTDDDDDGFGVLPSVSRCDASSRFPVDVSDDCDDGDAKTWPGAPETAGDGLDQDCDGADLDPVDYAEVLDPCASEIADGDTITVEGRVYASGFTDATGAGALRAEAGWGDLSVDPSGWTWTSGSWARDAAGVATKSDDVWEAELTPDRGTWGLLWRFSNDGGRSHTYGDLGALCGGVGSDDGADDPVWLVVLDPSDRDGDGYTDDDCDDDNPAVNPGMDEIYGDAVDNDCDGEVDETVAISTLSAGDLVISEILYDPSAVGDTEGEWFEVYNPGFDAVDLDGLIVDSNKGAGTESFTVGGSVVVDAGSYLLFGRSADTTVNGGAPVSYGWGTSGSALALANSGDAIRLYVGTTLIDGVTYGTGSPWPSGSGRSLELSKTTLDAMSNDSGAAWCTTTATFGSGDRGSPGAASSGC